MRRAITAIIAGLSLAPAGSSAEPADRGIDLLYYGPRCLTEGDTSINLITILFDWLDRHPGRSDVRSSGYSAFARGDRWLLPERDVADATVVSRFVADGGELRREVLERSIPVLDSPWELVFQHPYRGHFDWIRIMSSEANAPELADVTVRRGDLVRLSRPGGLSVLALELEPLEGPASARTATAAGLPIDPLAYTREFAILSSVVTPDDDVGLYSIGKQIARGARLAFEVERLRRERPGALLLQPGGVIGGWASGEERKACLRSVASLSPDAMVPQDGELARGVEGLVALAKEHRLPFVAANLLTEKGARPFPRFLLEEREGLSIAIVGLVMPDQLTDLPASVRRAWRVTDPAIELSKTREAIVAALGRWPDLVVVLVSAQKSVPAEITRMYHVDVVLGDFTTSDLVGRTEHIEIARERPRERARYPSAPLVVRGNRNAVGRIRARFSAEEARLAAIDHEVRPVIDEGPRDEEIDRTQRQIEEAQAGPASRLVLPDVAPIVAESPELEPLVYGDHLPYHGVFRRYEKPAPARFSDPLWMRLVTNAMLEATGADLALSRALPRSFDMVGPVTQLFLNDWLTAADSLRVAELSGADVARIAERMRAQRERATTSSAHFLYAGGLDAEKNRVAGRPIDPRERYEVALTDHVVEHADFADIFANARIRDQFVRRGRKLAAGADGAPVLVTEVVRHELEAWRDPAKLRDALRSRADQMDGRWRLRFDALSVSVAKYTNSEEVGRYFATRETRVTTPDNYSLGIKGDVALVYDGPAIAWESRVKSELSRVVIQIPGQTIPPQEQADDLLAFTELRLNAVRLELGGEGVRVVPFGRAAFDTELTPTPEGPDATFPHQKIVRGNAGFVAYPGAMLREVRIGALAQVDVSEADPHQDYGLGFGLALRAPLTEYLTFTSDLDLRWLAPDGDDRISDLGLYVSWVSRLLVPAAADVSLFLMADVVAVSGKVEETRGLGGSWIFAAGLDFARVFRL